MFATNCFGAAYFAQGPVGIVVLVLFGTVIVATLVSTNADLTVESKNAVWIVADGNSVQTVDFLG